MSFPSRPPLLIGHRGAPLVAPENTLEAFERALAAGVGGLELDVHRTADGILAVHHDPDTGGRFLVDMTWSELRAVVPGVPRLEEVFELVDGHPGAHLNIEVKQAVPRPDGRAGALAEALRGWRGPGRELAWISSFDPFELLRLARLDVGIPLAYLVSHEEALDLLPCLPVAGVHPRHSLATRERVRSWRERGLFVFAWTVNDREVALDLLRAGVDGIIGDDPEVMLAALEASGRGADR